MKLYLKQKVFSWGDKFWVYDESGNERYSVRGEVFTIGKKLHVYDGTEREVVMIRQKIWSFLPRYYLEKDGEIFAEVVKRFTLFHPRYEVPQFGWTVAGDFLAHNYCIRSGEETVAQISKKWFAWGDTYEVDFGPASDHVQVLAVVLVIDACLAAESAASASVAASSAN